MDAAQNDYFKVTGTWQKLGKVVQSFVFESVPVRVPSERLKPGKSLSPTDVRRQRMEAEAIMMDRRRLHMWTSKTRLKISTERFLSPKLCVLREESKVLSKKQPLGRN